MRADVRETRPDTIWVVFVVTNLLIFEHQGKPVSWDLWWNQSWWWLEEGCHKLSEFCVQNLPEAFHRPRQRRTSGLHTLRCTRRPPAPAAVGRSSSAWHGTAAARSRRARMPFPLSTGWWLSPRHFGCSSLPTGENTCAQLKNNVSKSMSASSCRPVYTQIQIRAHFFLFFFK